MDELNILEQYVLDEIRRYEMTPAFNGEFEAMKYEGAVMALENVLDEVREVKRRLAGRIKNG